MKRPATTDAPRPAPKNTSRPGPAYDSQPAPTDGARASAVGSHTRAAWPVALPCAGAASFNHAAR